MKIDDMKVLYPEKENLKVLNSPIEKLNYAYFMGDMSNRPDISIILSNNSLLRHGLLGDLLQMPLPGKPEHMILAGRTWKYTGCVLFKASEYEIIPIHFKNGKIETIDETITITV